MSVALQADISRPKWRSVKLGDILTLINGRAYKKDEERDSGTPVLRIQNLNGGDRWFYSDLSLPENKYCEKGDLLFAWSATFGPYIWWGEKVIYHYHIWKIECGPELDKKFAYYLLQHITERVQAAGRGISMIHMTKGGMEDWDVSIPPLDEQKRIAAILDQADELRRKRQRAIDRLNQLGQAIFHEMFGARLRLDNADATIGMVSERVTKGESPKWQGHSYVDEGALFVTSENVGWGAMLEKTPKFIPLEFHDGKLSRSKLQNGDLLINLVGASIGRACIFQSDHKAANINQAVAVVTLKATYPIADYLLTYLLSPAGQEQILGSRVEGARANISLKDVRDFSFHMPSKAELEEFASAKSTLARLGSDANSAMVQSTALFTSLQHRAFQGEL